MDTTMYTHHPLAAKLPTDAVERVMSFVHDARVVARCGACDAEVLTQTFEPAVAANETFSCALHPTGYLIIHASDGQGVRALLPRVDDDPTRAPRYIPTRCLVSLRHADRTNQIYRTKAPGTTPDYFAVGAALFNNRPGVVQEARPFTRVGSTPFCVACVGTPRRAFQRWRSL